MTHPSRLRATLALGLASGLAWAAGIALSANDGHLTQDGRVTSTTFDHCAYWEQRFDEVQGDAGDREYYSRRLREKPCPGWAW